MRCVNTVSGYVWTVAIPTRRLAGGRPATLTPARLGWRDAADGSLYDLDRVSGTFTVTRGSSTGGYVSTYRCRA